MENMLQCSVKSILESLLKYVSYKVISLIWKTCIKMCFILIGFYFFIYRKVLFQSTFYNLTTSFNFAIFATFNWRVAWNQPVSIDRHYFCSDTLFSKTNDVKSRMTQTNNVLYLRTHLSPNECYTQMSTGLDGRNLTLIRIYFKTNKATNV